MTTGYHVGRWTGFLATAAAARFIGATARAAGTFQEANGLVVMEVESAPATDDWSARTSLGG